MTKLGVYEDDPILKRNQDFSTIIDEYIAEDNIKLVQVFSERMRKVKESRTEKAIEIMMCIIFSLSNKPELLTLFDWFLKQTNIPKE